VVICSRKLPSGRVQWRGRFRDPDSGKLTDVALDPLVLRSAEARREWAIKKARSLATRKMEIASGAPRATAKTIEDAIADYNERSKRTLRERTRRTYGQGIERFRRWAAKAGIVRVSELGVPQLAAFKDHLISLPHQRQKRGGRRGERESIPQYRGPNAVNAEMRPVKTLLTAWRRSGLLPLLTSDAIADVLLPLPTTRERVVFLLAAQIHKLLNACLMHDSATYAETRVEHAGFGKQGTTPRYDAIAPFAAFVLLSGCRCSEALTLSWDAVDLGAIGDDGQAVGEIHLRAVDVKTATSRSIDLSVSPGLRELLEAMRRHASGPYVFGGDRPLPYSAVESARKRLQKAYDAPVFTWQDLRRTAASHLTNAPGIFGSASLYRSAAQLGHSAEVAQRRYLGVVKGIPREARTLEAAMGCHLLVRDIVLRVGERQARVTERAPERRRRGLPRKPRSG
jgi:integrase